MRKYYMHLQCEIILHIRLEEINECLCYFRIYKIYPSKLLCWVMIMSLFLRHFAALSKFVKGRLTTAPPPR